MLAPGLYVQLSNRSLTRQQFIDRISSKCAKRGARRGLLSGRELAHLPTFLAPSLLRDDVTIWLKLLIEVLVKKQDSDRFRRREVSTLPE